MKKNIKIRHRNRKSVHEQYFPGYTEEDQINLPDNMMTGNIPISATYSNIGNDQLYNTSYNQPGGENEFEMVQSTNSGINIIPPAPGSIPNFNVNDPNILNATLPNITPNMISTPSNAAIGNTVGLSQINPDFQQIGLNLSQPSVGPAPINAIAPQAIPTFAPQTDFNMMSSGMTGGIVSPINVNAPPQMDNIPMGAGGIRPMSGSPFDMVGGVSPMAGTPDMGGEIPPMPETLGMGGEVPPMPGAPDMGVAPSITPGAPPIPGAPPPTQPPLPIPIVPPTDIGKIKALKSIQSRLLDLSAILDKFSEEEYGYLKEKVIEAIEMFNIMVANFPTFRDKILDIAAKYKKFIKSVILEIKKIKLKELHNGNKRN